MGFFSRFFKRSSPDSPKGKAPAEASKAKAPPKPRLSPVNIERRFQLQNRIGQGSMSRVWRAIDNKTGRLVCLKVLDKEKTDALLKRFVGLPRPDEGEIAMSLDHPNVVKTFEHGITNKKEQFLVMEFVEGVGMNFLVETRDTRLKEHGLSYLIQLGEAIAYFHEKGYIHRDICPRNAVVTPENVLKLIDFGLAVPNTPPFRRPGNRTGTANYMAPELIRRSATDQRIDVFSFGVTVYETLTGTLPWESAASLQAMVDHINQPGRDPKDACPDLDEETCRVIRKGIERDRTIRYQTMKAFIADLRGLAGEQSDDASAE